ncbi:MAG: PEP-CTERM sorting domain-containing protein, partial [Acidobacteriaceae bacterium]|nr:PEP-CTERM sorting domain-containing protein [Acidobacteriaceae bacterium]
NINRVTGVDYTGWQTDVGYNGSTFGVFSAGTATPGLDDRNTADVIGWQFNAGLPGSFVLMTPGSTSVILEVETDAKNFTDGFMIVIDGSSATVAAFAPAPPSTGPTTPEPATMLMLGTGLLAFAGLGRFRRK